MLSSEPVSVPVSFDRTSVVRRIFSFPVAIAALLVVLTVLSVRSRLHDPDMWWHLKVGEIIWNTHTIPTTDLFSFTTNNHSWIPHEWLSEMSIYAAYNAGGYTGLMLWLCALSSLIVVASYVLCWLYSGNSKVAFVGAAITWFFATVGFGIRPHLVGYLLLALELLVLQLVRSRDPRYVLLLPFLFGLWVNCHGSFFLGLLIFAISLLCSFVDLRLGLINSVRWESSRRRLLALGFALSVVALVLNPVGVSQIIYPVMVMFNLPDNLRFVSEWQPISFATPHGVGLLTVLGCTVLVLLVRRVQVSLLELLLVLLASWMALRHARMLFVFGIIVSPVLCRLAADLWDNYVSAKDRWVPNAVLLLLSVAVVLFLLPSQSDLEHQVRRNNPVDAVNVIRNRRLSGPMVNDYKFGGYLIWAMPEHKVFIDGRGDVFEWAGVFRQYIAWATLREDPVNLLNNHRIRLCVLANNNPLRFVLPHLPGWRLEYSDSVAIIFTRDLTTSTPK